MDDLTLADAASRFADSLKGSARRDVLAEVNRFVHWYRGEMPLARLSGHEVSRYADELGPATPEASRRADHVRSFLIYLKKAALLDTNLAPHLRLRKGGSKSAHGPGGQQQASVELTREGIDALEAELESLAEQRIAVREEIRHAMLDKDFRENAPLDAAKDKQGHIEARVRQLEATLRRAVVVHEAPGGRVRVGATVHVRNLARDTTARFLIVGPAEANAADGKISSASPVGKALLDRTVGDEVEVAAPAGTMLLKVERIESS